MPTPPETAAQGPMSRAEKLSILSAMLGPDAMARLRGEQADGQTRTPPVEVDAERAAWQRNKLLARLRDQVDTKTPERRPSRMENGTASGRGARMERAWGAENAHLDARLARLSDPASLGGEHPAIIVRLLKALPREERVEALKALPGPLARRIVRRLR